MHPRPGRMHLRGTKGLRAFLIAISSGHVLSLSRARELRFVRRVRGSVRSWIYTAADPEDSSSPRHCISHIGHKRGVDDPDGPAPRTIRYEGRFGGLARSKNADRAVATRTRILTSIHKPIWNATDHTYYMMHAGCSGDRRIKIYRPFEATILYNPACLPFSYYQAAKQFHCHTDRSVVSTFPEPDKCRENSSQRKLNFRFYLMIFDFRARQGIKLPALRAYYMQNAYVWHFIWNWWARFSWLWQVTKIPKSQTNLSFLAELCGLYNRDKLIQNSN